ncbi:psiF repeat-containing protein [Roseiarcus fermentans]|uniref:PsiF repeat-containing protein n=1 Tax=Roseiarcus fermentans TaxID=1473586 RepID=A0A366F226_9HYPH|nr:PsiF family protein [Roseiarcus fermentans]RBP08713.1 psiF repeat-containing protein [Roseiarcus fermentans]
MRIKGLACAAALSALVSGGAWAFDAASDPAAPTGGAPGDAGARTARSLECSQKADAKDLHGKPRKRFMRDCKHGD